MRTAIIIFIGGFISGVFLRSFVDFGATFLALFLLIGLVLAILGRKNFVFAIFFVALSLGMFWFDFTGARRSEILDGKMDRNLKIEGIISDEPDKKEGGTTLVMEETETGAKILVRMGNSPEFKYGDKISAFGKIVRPENFSDFDYISYLAKDGIFYEMQKPSVALISSGHGSKIKEFLFTVKNYFLGSVNRAIPEPESSLLGGLILGARDSLPKELLRDFKTAGLVHIVVLSGYNLTVIANSVMKIFASFLPMFASLWAGSIAVVLFTFMAGASPATVRAMIMALVAILARGTGRVYNATLALIFAGFLMILQNPRVLVFDMSFQLSFLATLGLMCFGPKVKEKIPFVTEKFGLREILATTIGAQLATFPFILFKLGQLSVVALPANLFVLPLVPLTMFFGFLAGATNILNYFLALPFIFISYLLLAYEIFATKFFAALPYASLQINYFPFWALLVSYALIVVFLYWKRDGKSKQ